MKQLLVLLTIGVFLGAGCSQSPTEVEELSQLDQTFGGYQPTPEAPAFGDNELLAEAGDEVDPGDPMATSIETDQFDHPGRHLVFAMRILWGQLRFDSTSTSPTDWTGGLSIDSGRIGVKRTIRFEPATDHLVPSTTPGTIMWVSQTTVHNDGILALIGVQLPPPDSTRDSTNDSTRAVDSTRLEELLDNEVHFRTGPLSMSFTLRELVTLDTVVEVDDLGNAVMFNGILVRPDLCPKGFLGGHWRRNEDGNGGEFKGRWAAQNGDRVGHLFGRYGVNSNGRRVFFGKIVNESGDFLALMRGVWRPVPDGCHRGLFVGVIYNAAHQPIGRLHGRYAAEEPGKGVFQGVWKMKCPRWDQCDRRWDDWDNESWRPGDLEEEREIGDRGI